MNYLYSIAFLGALSVIAGAFGAHVLEPVLSPDRLGVFEKSVFYHLTHTLLLAMLALQTQVVFIWAKRLLLAGILIFSGSLYLLVFTNTPWLGALTPIGGICLIMGWVFIGIEYKNSAKNK